MLVINPVKAGLNPSVWYSLLSSLRQRETFYWALRSWAWWCVHGRSLPTFRNHLHEKCKCWLLVFRT
jgi:hypothetical protein